MASKLTYGIILKYSGDLNVATGKIRKHLRITSLRINYLDPHLPIQP